jgi:hypothetical protein
VGNDRIKRVCFNCDALGGGFYKPRTEQPPVWFMGLDSSGEAQFACAGCKDLLFPRWKFHEEGVADV